MTAVACIRAGAVVACRPWPRHVLSAEQWWGLVRALPGQPEVAFVALWADPAQVHALFWCGEPLLASVAVEAGLYAALSGVRPGAALFERMVTDLWGHQAADARDVRPWLDHGAWPVLRPLAERPVPNAGAAEVPEMLAFGGDVVGFGPLPPLPGGVGHWRVGVEEDRISGLEVRLGYGHRGVLGLMRGKSVAGAARLVARVDGAATVAHAVAFARAVEAALGTVVPPRGVALREVLLAVERVAVGLFDLQAAGVVEAELAREGVLAACGVALGHRLMMDLVRPGGVLAEVGAEGVAVLDAALAAVSLDGGGGFGGGVLPVGVALGFGVGGVVGRASGRMDPVCPGAAVVSGGDGAARMELRLAGLAADVAAARAGLAGLPGGGCLVVVSHEGAEGLGMAEGPQGVVWHWVRLAGGVVSANFAADPGWLLLPALEAAAVGVRLGDLPGVAASFGLHVGGMEL